MIMTRVPHINIGLFGFGTVGASVYQLMNQNGALLTQKLGYPIHIKRIFDPESQRFDKFGVPKPLRAVHARDLLDDPEISIIVELIGDKPVAKETILSALKSGKHVVCANKAILANHGPEIYQAASDHQVEIFFEAAVGGAIPILRALRESFVADQIESILGIINGTANYILTEMDETGRDFAVILKEAQERGYAEANPASDIEGLDSAHKIIILTALAHGQIIPVSKILIEGISHITRLDFDMAKRFQKKIKLLAISKREGDTVDVRVHPTMINEAHMLASVKGAFNAVMVRGRALGDALLYGLGAGGFPTATAVVADIVELARNIALRAPGVPPLGIPIKEISRARLKPIDDITSEYYLRVSALDKPGVFARVANILGTHNISISSVYQHGREEGAEVPIVVFTHEVLEKNMAQAVKEIDRQTHVVNKTVLLRVEK